MQHAIQVNALSVSYGNGPPVFVMSIVMNVSGFAGLMAFGRMVQSVAMTLFARIDACMAACSAAFASA